MQSSTQATGVGQKRGDSQLQAAGGQVRGPQSQPQPEPATPCLPRDRPLHHQQRPLNSDEPYEGAERLLRTERPALRDPEPPTLHRFACHKAADTAQSREPKAFELGWDSLADSLGSR